MFSGAVLAAVLLAAQPPTVAAQDVATSQPTQVDEVVVTGQRGGRNHQEAVADHVRSLARPTSRGRLARWRGELCAGVVGWPQEHGAYIAERIADEAHALGVRVGASGCRPNVLVLVTSQADRAAADLQDRYGGAFLTGERRGSLLTGQSQDDLRAFLDTDAAVRTWHVSRLASSDGRPIDYVQLDPGDPLSRVPALAMTGSSRLASGWAEELNRVYVIVDTTRLAGATYEQLTSYVAMAALAQVDEDAEGRRFPTILSLFSDIGSGRAAAEGLTDWDRAFLTGLYRARSDAPNLVTQTGHIRRAVEAVGSAGRTPDG